MLRKKECGLFRDTLQSHETKMKAEKAKKTSLWCILYRNVYMLSSYFTRKKKTLQCPTLQPFILYMTMFLKRLAYILRHICDACCTCR